MLQTDSGKWSLGCYTAHLHYKDTHMDLSPSQLRKLPTDICENILALSERKPVSGLCRELSADLRRNTKGVGPGFSESGNNFVVPFADLLRTRALTATNFSAGGALVGEELSKEIEKALRPASAIFRAGAVPIFARGNFRVGKEAAPATFNWLPEIASNNPTDSVFAGVQFTPHRLAGATLLDKQLEVQTKPAISQFLIESLSIGAAVGLEAGALAGSGTNGQPLGLFLTSGTNAVTFGGPAVWNSVLNFELAAATANADDEAVSFVAHPGVRFRWRGLQRFSGGSQSLWDGDSDTVAGKPARVTNNLATGQICCGDFSKLGVVIFGGADAPLQITVDPFNLAPSGQIRIFVEMLADTGPIRPEIFVVSEDSAVQ